MSGNTSATGGPLLPSSSAAGPLEGQDLNRFLQSWVVGVTGLPGQLVRPRWQIEPADVPVTETYWAAVGIARRGKLGFPQIIHNAAGDGSDQMLQQEQIDLLCSFYDLGTNGQADFYASLLRDGAFVDQNSEALELQGFAVVDVSDITPVPVLLKQRWYYRADVTVTFSRAIGRTYPVLNVLAAEGTITADPAYSTTFATGTIAE